MFQNIQDVSSTSVELATISLFFFDFTDRDRHVYCGLRGFFVINDVASGISRDISEKIL